MATLFGKIQIQPLQIYVHVLLNFSTPTKVKKKKKNCIHRFSHYKRHMNCQNL